MASILLKYKTIKILLNLHIKRESSTSTLQKFMGGVSVTLLGTCLKNLKIAR
jgi:hypothetical protein